MIFWSKKTPKILLVEDNLNNHPLYRSAFEAAGFEVLICQNAEDDFIDEVVQFKPDIISMDLMIAKEGREITRDGFAAIELLQTEKLTKKIPVIILTNFSEQQKILRAKKLGAVDFISLQGQSLHTIAAKFKAYVDAPRKYQSSHPEFKK